MSGGGFATLWGRLDEAGLGTWRAAGVPEHAERALREGHGDLPRWLAALDALPSIEPNVIELRAPTVRIGAPGDADAGTRERLEAALMELHPWRKGPFELFGVEIDAEWRSDLKWARLAGAIADPEGRRVLDVGSGNGYYAWRMRGAGASFVVGVDPGRLHVVQALAVRRYLPDEPVWVLPLAHEALPPGRGEFDTVLSMGVVYHRRDPAAHLAALLEHLRPGGEAIIESIVVPGGAHETLRPPGRYARMPNVHCLPSAAGLLRWLEGAGFADARLVDESPTTPAEQRTTRWMRFGSLRDALDPDDPTRTVEGWPAPRRAVVLAHRPGTS